MSMVGPPVCSARAASGTAALTGSPAVPAGARPWGLYGGLMVINGIGHYIID